MYKLFLYKLKFIWNIYVRIYGKIVFVPYLRLVGVVGVSGIADGTVSINSLQLKNKKAVKNKNKSKF